MSFFRVLLLVSILTITKRGKKMTTKNLCTYNDQQLYSNINNFKISLINKLCDEIDTLYRFNLTKEELKFTNELVELLQSQSEV